MAEPDQVRFRCPKCRVLLKIHPDFVGLETFCPHCSGPVTVPGRTARSTETQRVRGDATRQEVLSLDDCQESEHRENRLLTALRQNARRPIVYIPIAVACVLLAFLAVYLAIPHGGSGGSGASRPAEEVDGYTLWNLYGRNPPAANDTYRDRTLRVTGFSAEVHERDGGYALWAIMPLDGPAFGPPGSSYDRIQDALSAGPPPPGIIAHFSSRPTVKLPPNQAVVTVQGRCVGRVDDPRYPRKYYVLLKGCELSP